jgi:hypothetical protein
MMDNSEHNQNKDTPTVIPHAGHRDLRAYQMAGIDGGVFVKRLKEIGRGLGN